MQEFDPSQSEKVMNKRAGQRERLRWGQSALLASVNPWMAETKCETKLTECAGVLPVRQEDDNELTQLYVDSV